MHKLLLSFILVLAVLGVAATEYTEEESVLVLGDKDLAQAIQEFENILVEFYAPWCGHCKSLEPEYAKAAISLKESGSTIKLAKVDATIETEVASQHEIQGYPTLKFFQKGVAIDFNGGRTSSEIIRWLNKKTQPSIREATTSDEIKKELGESLVLIFWGDNGSVGYAPFESASKNFDDIAFFVSNSQELKAELKVTDGTQVLLLKNFDEGRNELTKAFELSELLEFIAENRYPLVLPFGDKAVDIIFAANKPALVLLVQNNESGEKLRAIFQEIAPGLRGKILVTVSDVDDEVTLGPVLLEFFGLSASMIPTVRILSPQEGEAPRSYGIQEELTKENILRFYEDFAAGNLKPAIKSEPIPDTNDDPVKVVVAKSFESIVLDSSKDVFIEFYAPWCGHCQELAPIWEDLATSLAPIGDLVIAKMDATANDVDSVQIEGFPTLYFYPKDNKQNPIQFAEERSKESLIEFLKQKITVAHDPNIFGTKPEANADKIEL